VFHDPALASDIRKAEQRFRVGHIRNLAAFITELIHERYDFSPGAIEGAAATREKVKEGAARAVA
jgi:hypothetical protein